MFSFEKIVLIICWKNKSFNVINSVEKLYDKNKMVKMKPE